MDDSGIIELYLRRAETAIEETARKYGTYLNSVAYRILNSREDAEEIVGDTYLKTWNAIPPTRPRVLKHFLTRITRNLSFDRVEVTAILNRFLGELDELSCCVFLSRYYYAHTLKEVAAQYDLPEGKVRYLLTKTRERLKRQLTEEGITV